MLCFAFQWIMIIDLIQPAFAYVDVCLTNLPLVPWLLSVYHTTVLFKCGNYFCCVSIEKGGRGLLCRKRETQHGNVEAEAMKGTGCYRINSARNKLKAVDIS